TGWAGVRRSCSRGRARSGKARSGARCWRCWMQPTDGPTRGGKPSLTVAVTLLPTCCNSIARSEEHTSELQSRFDLVCRLLLEKKKKIVFVQAKECINKLTTTSDNFNFDLYVRNILKLNNLLNTC